HPRVRPEGQRRRRVGQEDRSQERGRDQAALMFHLVRIETIHPALAHFTVGGLPLIVVAYAIAVWRRSPAWTLVGDAGLVVTAALTLGTAAFGLVSNAVVPWPGGLEEWRQIHLIGGVAR